MHSLFRFSLFILFDFLYFIFKIDLRESRGAIYHMAAQGRSAKDIREELVRVHAREAPSYATMARWCQQYRFGRKDLDNRVSTERLWDAWEAMTSYKISEARRLVTDNRSISLRMLSSKLNLAHQTVKIIMETELRLRKTLARWVPHELSERQRQARMDHAQSFLAQWGHRWSRLVSKLVNETWVSYPAPYTRQSASEWRDAAIRHQNCRDCPAIGGSPWRSISRIAKALSA